MSEHQQEVKLIPRLSLVGVVVFGVSYMAPAVVIATFGVIAILSHGASASAYLFATVAMLLTALSYGKLARKFPASGSIYTYTRRTLGSQAGFLAGWVILLDYLFLPMVAWLITSLYFSAQFPFLPGWVWGTIIITICTSINFVGLKLADRFNRVLLCIVMIGVIALVGFGLVFAFGSPISVGAVIWPETASLPAVVAGAAVAAYSFLGFDAVSTLSEEVKDPKRNVPRGIVLVVLVGGVIFVTTSLVMQWTHPSLDFTDVDTAGYEVATLIGGPVFAGIVNTTLLIGGLSSCVAVQASGSRLLFVMGRDGVFPRRVFGRLHNRFRTPVFNLVLIALIGLAGQFLSIGDATSLINFGAFLAFAIANVCVIVLWWKNRSAMPLRKSAFGFVIVPILGFAVDIYLLFHLSGLALTVGAVWLVVGVVYLLCLTRGFKSPTPGLDNFQVETNEDV